MVRALLAGTKTQTRRVVKLGVPDKHGQAYVHRGRYAAIVHPSLGVLAGPNEFLPGSHPEAKLPLERVVERFCPYGVPGDRLWVRETWAHLRDLRTTDPGADALGRRCFYRSDHPTGLMHDDGSDMRWRPAIFMPRWASRITLELESVRVERLRAISEEDATAEGCTGHEPEPAEQGGTIHAQPGRSSAPSPRAHYAHLWDKINGKRPGCTWKDNPWVWVLSFHKIGGSDGE